MYLKLSYTKMKSNFKNKIYFKPLNKDLNFISCNT